jgi:hypothetical protein
MLMTDAAAAELAARMDVYLRFGGLPPGRDDLAALLADWTEARAAITHVIALHRQARAELAELDSRAPRPAPPATVHPIRRPS